MFHSGMRRRTSGTNEGHKGKTAAGLRRPLAQKSIPELVAILDTEFSFNVRARAVLEGGGLARCCTCGQPGGVKELDCGHYITRAIHRTRWLRMNTGPQCPKCNRFMNGMSHIFREYLVNLYGDEMIGQMERAARDTGWRDTSEGLVSKIEAFRKENRLLREKLKELGQ